MTEMASATAVGWYALWTRSRHEQVVREQLSRKGFDAFLPTITKWSRWKDRKKQIDWPLFPGYCFVKLAPDDRLPVLKCTGVVNIVSFNGEMALIPDHEIDSIRQLRRDRSAVRSVSAHQGRHARRSGARPASRRGRPAGPQRRARQARAVGRAHRTRRVGRSRCGGCEGILTQTSNFKLRTSDRLVSAGAETAPAAATPSESAAAWHRSRRGRADTRMSHEEVLLKAELAPRAQTREH